MATKVEHIVVTYPDGREYGVADLATAKRAHPDAKVTRYQSGEPYESPKADSKSDEKKA